ADAGPAPATTTAPSTAPTTVRKPFVKPKPKVAPNPKGPKPVEIDVVGDGRTVAGTVSGDITIRYRLNVKDKGTVLIAIDPISGSLPRALLKTEEGLTIRRVDRRGRGYSRPPAG